MTPLAMVLAFLFAYLTFVSSASPTSAWTLFTDTRQADDAKRSARLEKNRCRREGSVRVEIGGHILEVPRILVWSLAIPDRGTIVLLECDVTSVTASRIHLRATTTRGGKAFYEDWIKVRGLPPGLLIYRTDRIRNDFQWKLEDRLSRGSRLQHDNEGAEFVENAASQLFILPAQQADGSPFKLYVDCQKINMIHGGHPCTALYRHGAFVISYNFTTKQFPKSEWLALDARVRSFIQSMMTDK